MLLDAEAEVAPGTKYDYVYNHLAAATGLSRVDVEDAVKRDKKFTEVQKIFAQDGARTLLFFYNRSPTENEYSPTASVTSMSSEHGCHDQDHLTSGLTLTGAGSSASISSSRGPTTSVGDTKSQWRLFITDGTEEELVGLCCWFLRVNTQREVDDVSVGQELLFGCLHVVESSLLEEVHRLVSALWLPALQNIKEWGSLGSSHCKEVDSFLGGVERFACVMSTTSDSLQERIVLRTYGYQQYCDTSTAARDHEAVSNAELTVRSWGSQVENLLAETEQVRVENDDGRPHTELQYWRMRTTTLLGIIEQLEGPECQAVLAVLESARSRALIEWKSVHADILRAANVSKENMRYLNSLETHFDTLSKANPGVLSERLPALMHALRMIYTTTTYYNSSERLAGLFIKVTNQLIGACRSYVLDGVHKHLWELSREELLARIQACVKLNADYRECYRQEKLMSVEQQSQRQFIFSENYVFGKFDKFCQRLHKIVEVSREQEKLECIVSLQFDNMENIKSRYHAAFDSLYKRSASALAYKDYEFDGAHQQFLQDVKLIQALLQELAQSNFEQRLTIEKAIRLLQTVQTACGNQVDYNIIYMRILNIYGAEVEQVRQTYEREKANPPIDRNMPPIAGRVLWARQLQKRIDSTMHMVQDKTKIMESPDAQHVIRKYTRLTGVLLKFEMLYHEAWTRSLEAVRRHLHSPVLCRDFETKEIFVNMDIEILLALQEARYMEKLKLKIPDSLHTLVLNGNKIKSLRGRLEQVIGDYKQSLSSIPNVLRSLLRPLTAKVDQEMLIGLTSLSWISINIEQYVSSMEKSIQLFSNSSKPIIDIATAGPNDLLSIVAETPLCHLPTDDRREPMTMAEFQKAYAEACRDGAAEINRCIQKLGVNVHEVIKLLRELANKFDDRLHPNVKQFQEGLRCIGAKLHRCRKCWPCSYYSYFQNITARLAEAITTCTRLSLQSFSRCVRDHRGALLAGDVALDMPAMSLRPSVAVFRSAVDTVMRNMLDVALSLPSWEDALRSLMGQMPTQVNPAVGSAYDSHAKPRAPSRARVAPPAASPLRRASMPVYQRHKSLGKTIEELPEVVECMAAASAALEGHEDKIQSVVREFDKFSEIWLKDPKETVAKFKETNPEFLEYEKVIDYYSTYDSKIDDIPPVYNIGPIKYETEAVKYALRVEVKTWQQTYASCLQTNAKNTLEDMADFVKQMGKKLIKPVASIENVQDRLSALDDVRHMEMEFDRVVKPIEDTYEMMARHDISDVVTDTEYIENISYKWKRLVALARVAQDNLVVIQPALKADLTYKIDFLKEAVEAFANDYNTRGPMVQGLPPDIALDRIAIFQAKFDELWAKHTSYSCGEQLFHLEISEYPELTRIKKQLGLLQRLYQLYSSVITTMERYQKMSWLSIDTEKLGQDVLDFQNSCWKLPKSIKEWSAYNELKKKIDDWNETVPLLELMANKAMQQRHWDKIAFVTGYKLNVNMEGFLLKDLMNATPLEHKDDIEEICVSAVKENDIEGKLNSVVTEWETQTFCFTPFKHRGNLLLKGEHMLELILLMEDNLMLLSSLMSNRYNGPFKLTIQTWVQKLTGTTEVLEMWMAVQNLWVYMEAVFVGGDISKQLPQEARRFQNIDKSWSRVIVRAHKVTNVVQCCVGDDFLGVLLPRLQDQLEICQKSLSGYLEKKRLVFPRFFFVSDPALLEILGQASDPHTIQAHLLSVFDNTKAVVFDDDEYEKILTMVSQEGETIDLEQPVYAKGNVEVWLGEFLKASMRSIQGIVNNAVTDMDGENFNMFDFQTSFPAQVGRLGMQVMWTKEAEAALQVAATERKAMHATSQRFNDMLKQLIDITLKELMPMDRVKFETLVTIHVHQRDIFDDMVKQHVTSLSDFEWLKQSRFYYHHDTEQSVVSITNIDFLYQHEFLGCTERLVITPLTDRCYITLAQALGMSMGGAPSGPAGTGKTETIKDMGRCLGKYVIVFNCSDQMDYRGLGRIFKGLAQSGSWGCFDEFNRIELPVLSVAAQQIAVVHSARKDKKKQFTFTDGDTVFLNPEFGFFLTMNPSYAGRVELPENLKVQFRSVSMMVPDRQIIIRVKLASSGFQNNVVLASKFYTLYVLCEEQLTKQVHYDFGLRNILSVLRTLGAFKRSNPQDSESMIVMRVLRDMNLSKLVDEDEPLFLSLINDLFPGMKLDKGRYPDIEAAIQQQVTKLGLINHEPWVLKLMQLYETQRVRHGMMTLGPSGSGKSTCIQVLMKAMTEVGVPHKEMRMNPKAITAAQMFGKLDVTTNDWTDGIFSALWRKTLRTKKGEHTWIVLDGPIDAIWIENLNSVLDDNKTLTLANGDRIPMSPSCKVIFEPDNIENASPATVSRNGMVYMSSSVLDWNPVLRAWMKKQPKGMADRLLNLFQWNFESLYNFVEVHLNAKMSVLQINYIKQAINLLEGLIPRDEEGNVRDHNPVLLERLFVFTCMWSLGALLETDDRNKLQEFFYQQKRMDMPPVNNDDESTMFDYFVDSRGSWQHWKTKVPGFEYPSNFTVAYPTILVPNVDNVRTEFLINAISAMDKAVLLIGEQGTAKTVIIKNHCNKYDQEHHLFKNFSFSSATTPMIFQRTIESYVDKRIGNNYGPPNGRKMTVFVDDLNLPVVNEWGDQPTNETMRQLLEMKGFYNLEKPGDFTKIADVQFVAAMIQPGGGRNDIPSRLKRHFSIFNCTLPSDQSIDQIFSVICKGHFRQDLGFSREICRTAAKLVPLTRRLWQNTKQCMMPTPAKFHYIFNLRDLSRIWQGMLNATSEVVAEKDNLIRLWKHECTRVIADRFVCEDDTRWFRSAQQELVESSFSKDDIKGSKSDVYFADFLREAPEPTGEEDADIALVPPKIYEPIESFDKLRVKLLSYVGQYNESTRGDGLDLVFFRDAMVHMVRIARVLATPQGNCLLVGVGGCGKRVLTKLASFINGYQFHTITLARGYNVSNFLDDLKGLFRRAGVDAKKITFFFCEKDIKDESFMEYMNNILSSGEISNLFTRDETEEICQFLTPVFKRERLRTMLTTENLYGFFLDRVKANLHIVLSFSPVGERFRNWALKFPGLISGCTMDWFQRWPKDALVAMSQHFLDNFSLLSNGDTRSSLVAAMADYQDLAVDLCQNYFQRFRRQTHVTPKTYLSFLNSYKEVYTNKLEEISTLSARINNGLQKLQEATESVEELSQELLVKEQNLQVASEKAEQVLEEVTEKATLAQNAKRQVQQVKDRAQALVDSIAADKGVAEERLEDAKPALKEAEAALQTILPAHIASVRKLGKPPNLIMLIMDCVLLLFKKSVIRVIPDMKTRCVMPSWQESLKLMSGTAFLQQLLNFPKDTINDEVTELLEPYLRREDYNIVEARRVCGDVAGLCSWTRAMVFFHGINKEALPLKDNVAKAEARLRKAVADLDQAETELSQKQQELDTVKAMYESALLEKQRLVDDAAQCRRKIENAKALLLGLSDEKLRWTESSGTFRMKRERLTGDVLLATGFLSYAGPFNQEFRARLLDSWKKMMMLRKISYSQDLNIIGMLVDKATISEWTLQGLPNDELSVENGIMVTKTSRYPLLIDPQGQGKHWIRNRESGNNLLITSLNHRYFKVNLEDCLSQGRPILIENLGEEIDPVLDNILQKNFYKVGAFHKVKLGDKEVDVMKGFALYLQTELANPVYSPDVSARTNMIDFTVTMKGLEDQLLGVVILTEKQELEAERNQLLIQIAANRRRMQELEDTLLHRLSTVEGSLIDDQQVVSVLKSTKQMALEVQEKLNVAAETEAKINAAREEYRAVATRGSILYFLITEMSMVNIMYQTSLKQFLVLFNESMAKSAKTAVPSKRIGNIIDYMTFRVFKYVTQGLYENDKFLFTLLLAIKINLTMGTISEKEFQTFIKGGAALDMNSAEPKPKKWIPDITWLNLVQLSNLKQFQNILDQVTRNDKAWKTWYDEDAPEACTIPDGYSASLLPFSRLLLYTESQFLNLAAILEESDCRTPLVCLLSQGSDPSEAIARLAAKFEFACSSVSMGQGQELHARRLLAVNMPTGGWILLQNCHLGLEFMSELLETLSTTATVHETFRCWMTTEMHPKFSITMLQASIKFTNDPPMGIKASLKRTFAQISQDQLEANSAAQWRPMLYTVAFLHAVVQERRKFGPLGWNIPYEFNNSDFTSTVQFIQNHLEEVSPKKGISWATVRYMIGEVQYGGRVTDDFDKRLINTFARVWFSDSMFAKEFEFHEGYQVIASTNIEQLRLSIEKLPSMDSPEVFRLHPNANIAYQTNRANKIFSTILNIQPKDVVVGQGDTREMIVYKIVTDMLQKLPHDYQPHHVKERLNKMGALSSMTIFLRQEIDCMQKVISTVRATLCDLRLAIDGTIVMSDSLRGAVDSLSNAMIPDIWLRVSWESATLGFWFMELIERNMQLTTWLDHGRPKCFWMSGFFNPQGFLTAMRQEITRAHKGWSLDKVVLQNEVTKCMREDITAPPAEGVYISGLHLDGASWDRRSSRLAEPIPKVLFTPMPVVRMYADVVDSTTGSQQFYECPVYKKPSRTGLNYIATLALSAGGMSPDHWCLRGVALLCDVHT